MKQLRPIVLFKVLTKQQKEIEEKYNKLTKGKPAYTPVYAELKGIKLPVAKDGFASEYDGVFEVTEVIVLGSSENLEK